MKLNELAGAVQAILAQNEKSRVEILARIKELEDSLSNVDLPADAVEALDALKASVQQDDDIVPDQPPPVDVA